MVEKLIKEGAFTTETGTAIIVGRIPTNPDPLDDVIILVLVPHERGTVTRAFTTVAAMALAAETGRWTSTVSETAIAA